MAISIAVAVPVATAAAFNPEQRDAIKKVAAYINAITTLQGKFTQTGPDGRQVSGVFVISRPGRLLFRYEKPVPIEIVADGKAVVIRDKKLKTQDLYPLSKTPLRFLLSDEIDLARDTKVLSVTPDTESLEVVVEEETPLGTGLIALRFDSESYELREWTITDAQGLATSIALYEVESGKPTDPKWFWIDHLNRRSGNNR
ncbi:MAG: outer-membrane lipoprotein carrier protein LolA [Hyphomicrobiales bacterium]|nr:outer-membrane lipoprotein carrier protein LolA [Hyphomicrobiales bacterium]